VVCNRQQSDLVCSNGVEERVWEFEEQFLSHASPNDRCSIGELRDALDCALNFVDEYATKPRTFEVIKIGRFVDLDLGNLVDKIGDPFPAGPCTGENLISRIRTGCTTVKFLIAADRFVHP
jgi:hypothetical protein